MRFNVLHLIADDLRTSIGAYGHTDAAKTPHLDRLAAQGVVFENAYWPRGRDFRLLVRQGT